MSTLNGSSTDAAVKKAFDDNASWFEDGDSAKAAALVTAGTILLQRRPKSISLSGEEIELDLTLIQDEVTRARKYAQSAKAVSAGGSGATYFSLEDFKR